MAIDRKYGRIEAEVVALNEIPDEPVFVIRSKDASAVEAILLYGLNALKEGASFEFFADVVASARRVVEWQEANEDLVKVPD